MPTKKGLGRLDEKASVLREKRALSLALLAIVAGVGMLAKLYG